MRTKAYSTVRYVCECISMGLELYTVRRQHDYDLLQLH